MWSWILTAVGVTGLFFTINGKWWGQLIALSCQGLWLAYAIVTQQWGFIVSVFAFGGMNLYGIIKMRKEQKES